MLRRAGLGKVDVYAYAVRGLFDLEPDPDLRANVLDAATLDEVFEPDRH